MSIAFVLSSDRVSKLGLSDICIFDIIIFVFFGYTIYSIFFRPLQNKMKDYSKQLKKTHAKTLA